MSISDRFEKWINANPDVYRLFKLFANEARNAGRRHYSADAICHRIRWHVNIEMRATDGAEFKINDHYSSRLARKLIAEHPEFTSFFELRELKSEPEDDWIDRVYAEVNAKIQEAPA